MASTSFNAWPVTAAICGTLAPAIARRPPAARVRQNQRCPTLGGVEKGSQRRAGGHRHAPAPLGLAKPNVRTFVGGPGQAQKIALPLATPQGQDERTHFQMKTLKHVGTEMALHVLAYNMKRVMRILRVGGLEAIRA
jgi:hypothetical protein